MNRRHIPPVDAGNHTYEVHIKEDWAALYIDGLLDTGPGDAYLCDERLAEILGVKIVNDDAFMRGDNHSAAPTLDEVHAYADERDRKVELARQKVAEAEALLAEARTLNPQGR